MSVCFSNVPLPIPTGLRKRPIYVAINEHVDLADYNVVYRGEVATGDDTWESLDDVGKEACCGTGWSWTWPTAGRIGALYQITEGTYRFFSMIDSGYLGIIEYPPAVLTVTPASCNDEQCPACPVICVDTPSEVYTLELLLNVPYNQFGTHYITADNLWDPGNLCGISIALRDSRGVFVTSNHIVSVTPGGTYQNMVSIYVGSSCDVEEMYGEVFYSEWRYLNFTETQPLDAFIDIVLDNGQQFHVNLGTG